MLKGNSCGPLPVFGDRFDGLVVTGEDHEVFQFGLDGKTVEVSKIWQREAANLATLALQFKLSGPVRFRVDVLIPSGCANACATLNDQLLLGWFGDKMPAGQIEIITGACQDKAEKITTLHPGQFQSVNFRWEDRDCLRFYFVWQEALTDGHSGFFPAEGFDDQERDIVDPFSQLIDCGFDC